MAIGKTKATKKGRSAKNYAHPEASALLRPDAGAQAQFRKKKPPAAYVQASMDLVMGDLLKNLRSGQIFSVCGLPDVRIRPAAEGRRQVELLGLDVFDPVAMEADHRDGCDVPAWFLDTDYNGLCFHICQAFFPRTSAWESFKRSLRGEFEGSLWAHLSGTVSAPFQAGEHGQIAVKAIDDRGNELMVVKALAEDEA